MGHYEVLKTVKEFCTALLTQKLGKDLSFHNLSHTIEVVEACKEIALESCLTPEEIDILCIAAWFHDVGYCYTYENHEFESVNIAATFLNLFKTDEAIVKLVVGCILATQIPQQPNTILEKIICDADLYHLSRTNYHQYEQALRKEWEVHLRLFYTDAKWNLTNYKLLTVHSYFTFYGLQVLQPGKEENIKKLRQLLPPET
ncbi:HD domain-containing protein [Pedobacter sp. L105]|uniref:HD domain-containing protein n=1 Tax=Pedobacter sp. L105 TaxID=1641871 RepID=UPI00131B718C|nr:HD domain-containing protein [Pedobacter sp. L105]